MEYVYAFIHGMGKYKQPMTYSDLANKRVSENYYAAFEEDRSDGWSLGVLMKKLHKRLDSWWIDNSAGQHMVNLLRKPWTRCLVLLFYFHASYYETGIPIDI